MITFNNIVERFEIFAENHFFIKTFSFGSPDDADLSKFTDFPLMHLVYTGANYDAGTKTYNIEVYILDVPADKNDKVERQKEVVSDAEQCAEDIIADIKNGGNIFLFAQDYEVVNATTTPLEEETKNVLSGVLLDLSVAIPYEWDACNAPIDGVEPGGTEVTYARRGVLRMLTIDGTTDVQSVRTINVTNGTLTDDGDGVVTLDTGGAETLNDLTDVDTTGVTDGQVLKYASGEWLPGNDQSATSLGNLDDVSIVTPANREALIYDGSEWVNDTVAKGDIGLGNVDNTSDADKPVSTATQTALNAKANTADVPTSLNDLSDVTIVGTPVGNQALIYDATANAFKSQVSYTNRFEDEVETGKEMPTIFAERAYSVKSEGDGTFIDPESDTPAAGKVIVRKIYHKTGFITDADVIGDYTLIHTFADDTAYADTVATFEGFEDGATYGVPPFTLLQTWEEIAAAPAFTGLLNETYGSGAAAAYGTRRLNGNYSGACMTIRRASDGTTQAIGFVGEEIDESAITTFCSGTSCTVQVWHDQSQTGGTGSGNDATQTTPGNQPTIYTGGQLVKDGGRLALDFDGSNDGFYSSGVSLTDSIDVFILSHKESTANQAWFAFDATVNTNYYRQEAGSISIIRAQFTEGLFNVNFSSPNYQTQILNNLSGTNGAQEVFFDGVSVHTGNATFSNAGLSGLHLGIQSNGANAFNGKYQEFILYDTVKSSTNRTDIEGNISAYYQSAKLLDEQYGSGAEAAYSVRQLKRDNTECMVIRRASDSTTTTIGFDGSGNISEADIISFCTGTTCTVYQWLDQSGNGNTATAPSTGEEPMIYTGGALVKVNGKVALDTNDDHFLFNSTISFANDFTQFLVTKKDLTNNSGSEILSFGTAGTAVYAEGVGGGGLPVLKNTVGSQYVIHSSLNNNFAMTTADQQKLIFANRRGTTGASALDGGAEKTATASFTGTVSYESILGNTAGGFHSYDGFAQEAIFYADDKSSFRASIEENVGDYYTQNTPLLDTYSGAAAAYSLRLLDSSYVGSAIRVRRSSDNAEQDIGFNVFGELDTVSLLAFAGTGDAFVKTWYDQSGNSNDSTQTTTANQPKIVSSGAVIVENGKPAVEFDGSNDTIESTSNVVSNSAMSLFVPYKYDDTTSRPQDLIMSSTADGFKYGMSGTGRDQYAKYSPLETTTWANTTTNQVLDSLFSLASGGAILYTDGVLQTATGTAGIVGTNTATLKIGSRDLTSAYFNGKIHEVIIYDSDQSTNRTNIETNIATFYDITI